MAGGTIWLGIGVAALAALAGTAAMLRLADWIEDAFERSIEEEYGPQRPDEPLTRWRNDGRL